MDEPTAERLRELLERWFDAVESGNHPSVKELCRDDPALAPTLLRLIEQEAGASDLLARGEGSADPSRREPGPPERIGDFTILEVLGAGGMGSVYLARQESLRRLVALKLLRRDATRDAQSVLRFRREAEIAASLEHPNIVPVYAVGEEEGQAFLAMKRLSGPGLEQLAGRLDVREAARLGAALARALHAAHAAGVIHRDVKPGNVMMDGTEPCILDFGLARVGSDPRLTRQGAIAGTLPYMSPEQLRGVDLPQDARSDLYSLGVTLYELLSGNCPFAASDPEIAIHAILFRDPPTLGLRGADRDFETVVLRAMDKDPARRFASAAAFADELERFHDGRPIRSRRIGLVGRAFRLARRRPGTAATVSGLGLASLGLAGVLALRSLRDADEITADLAAIERRIEDGALTAARSLAEKLTSRAPDDRRVRDLATRLDAITRLDELLDLLQDRTESSEPGAIESLLGDFDDQDVFASDPRRERLLGIARVLAKLARDRLPDAEAAYRALRPSPYLPRTTRVLAAAFGLPSGQVVPGDEPEDSDDLALASVALRHTGRSDQDVLDALLAGQTSGYRVAFGLGVAYATLETPEGDARAEIAFRLGAIRDGEHPTPVLRSLARLAMIRHDFARTRDCLARLAERTGSTEPNNAVEASIQADLATREGRAEDAEAIIRRAIGRWPDSADLQWRVGRLHFDSGDFESAISACDRAADLARARGLHRLRDRARVSSLVARAATVLESGGPTRPDGGRQDSPQPLAAVIRDARTLRAEVETGAMSADVDVLLAQLLSRDDPLAARTHVQAALEADPGHLDARLLQASDLVASLDAARRSPPFPVDSDRHLMTDARRCIDALEEILVRRPSASFHLSTADEARSCASIAQLLRYLDPSAAGLTTARERAQRAVRVAEAAKLPEARLYRQIEAAIDALDARR